MIFYIPIMKSNLKVFASEQHFHHGAFFSATSTMMKGDSSF